MSNPTKMRQFITNIICKVSYDYLPVTLCQIDAMLAVTLLTRPPAIVLAC